MFLRCVGWLTLFAVTAGTACADSAVAVSGESAVYILEVDQLQPPEIPLAGAYKPVFFFDLVPGEPAAGRLSGFFLTVAAHPGSELMVRVRERGSGNIRTLPQVPMAGDRRGFELGEPGRLSQAARQALTEADGAYWVLGRSISDTIATVELAVVLPEDWFHRTAMLEVYAAVAPDGTPLGADRIELVRDFFYLAAVGDSIMTGNGLRDREKATSVVAAEIERRTGFKVVRRVHAISGVGIRPFAQERPCVRHCGGGAANGAVSITTQVHQLQRPEVLDVVLVAGCLNDVTVSTVLSTRTTAQELQDLTRLHCRDDMSELLHLLRERAPQAVIVVVGYYPILSEQSDPSGLEQLAPALGLPFLSGADLGAFFAAAARNSEVFEATSRESISAVIADLNAPDPQFPRVAFADPGFGPQNATLAPEAWLWGLTRDNDLADLLQLPPEYDLFPEDPLAVFRAGACLERGANLSYIPCIYASVGHPNPRGARAYADAILAALERVGVLFEG